MYLWECADKENVKWMNSMQLLLMEEDVKSRDSELEGTMRRLYGMASDYLAWILCREANLVPLILWLEKCCCSLYSYCRCFVHVLHLEAIRIVLLCYEKNVQKSTGM